MVKTDKARLINVRLSKEHEEKAQKLIKFFNEELGLELNFSDFVRMCINREYNKRFKEDKVDFA